MILYKDIYEFDIVVMTEILQRYGTSQNSWKLFCEFYKDPDGYAITDKGLKNRKGIECSADALLSINRIYEHEGFNEKFIETFIKYREVPIMFFPKERQGINQLRYAIFKDRIDYMIFDLKQYCEGNACKLEAAYSLPKTRKWIESFNYNFEEIMKWLKIDKVFVNSDNQVFDLEKKDGTIIFNYCEYYS